MEVNKCIKVANTADSYQYAVTKVEINNLISRGWRIISMVNVERREEIWVYMEQPDNSKPKKIKL